MRKGRIWWSFLRLRGDGWSSEFPSVDKLLRHLERKSRSEASRNSFCYNLWRICANAGVDPEGLIARAREDTDAVAELVQNFADKYKRAESVRYANNIIYLAKSFFKANKVELDLHNFFQQSRSRKRPEHIPSWKNGEALRMADVAGSLRNRLIILFLIFTGLRNSTLRALVYNESYPEPLLQEHTIKKELEKGEQCVAIVVHEVMKKRVPNACKNRLYYYTFIPPKVTEDLRSYLRERAEKYGPILDDELIFITENRRLPLSERRKTPISARELQEIVKNAAKRAGIEKWKDVYPHCLRKTYETFLRDQPDEVRLDVKEREFLFGHTLPGSQEAYFDKTKIEEMRAKYAKMIFEPVVSVEKEERVIREDELQTFLQNGWHFGATTPSGNIIVWRKSMVKPTFKTGVEPKPQNLFERGPPQQADLSNSALNSYMHDHQTKYENQTQKAKSCQSLEKGVEKPKNKEERNRRTLVSKQVSMDLFFECEGANHEEGKVPKMGELNKINIPSKTKKISILDYL